MDAQFSHRRNGHKTDEERAADLFRKATEAMANSDWKLAIALLEQAGVLAPDFEMYRQTLEGVQAKLDEKS